MVDDQNERLQQIFRKETHKPCQMIELYKITPQILANDRIALSNKPRFLMIDVFVTHNFKCKKGSKKTKCRAPFLLTMMMMMMIMIMMVVVVVVVMMMMMMMTLMMMTLMMMKMMELTIQNTIGMVKESFKYEESETHMLL